MARPQIAVYVLSNVARTVVGVTNDLTRRVSEHRSFMDPHSFTAKYRTTALVHYEAFESMVEAIRREKQLKGWTRVKKLTLLRAKNPGLCDLWDEVAG